VRLISVGSLVRSQPGPPFHATVAKQLKQPPFKRKTVGANPTGCTILLRERILAWPSAPGLLDDRREPGRPRFRFNDLRLFRPDHAVAPLLSLLGCERIRVIGERHPGVVEDAQDANLYGREIESKGFARLERRFKTAVCHCIVDTEEERFLNACLV
jgi:hypothetical protein